MIVWVSGPTGSGKSSLASVLHGLGYGLIDEELPAKEFRAFFQDPSRYCALLQEKIMLSRFAKWQVLSDETELIFDRSIDEDAYVFCRIHWEYGSLTGEQYQRLQTIAADLQSDMPKPDLIIFMNADQATLRERLTSASHPESIVQSLDRQVHLYTEWLATRSENILRLDNSGCSLQRVKQLLLTNTKYAQRDTIVDGKKRS